MLILRHGRLVSEAKYARDYAAINVPLIQFALVVPDLDLIGVFGRRMLL